MRAIFGLVWVPDPTPQPPPCVPAPTPHAPAFARSCGPTVPLQIPVCPLEHRPHRCRKRSDGWTGSPGTARAPKTSTALSRAPRGLSRRPRTPWRTAAPHATARAPRAAAACAGPACPGPSPTPSQSARAPRSTRHRPLRSDPAPHASAWRCAPPSLSDRI